MRYLIAGVCAAYLLWLVFAETSAQRWPKIFGGTLRLFQNFGLTFSGRVFGPKPRQLTPMLRFRVALNSGDELLIETDPARTHMPFFRNRAWVFEHNLVKANDPRQYLAYCRHFLRERGIELENVIAIRLDIRNLIIEPDGITRAHDFYWDLRGDPSIFEHKTSFA